MNNTLKARNYFTTGKGIRKAAAVMLALLMVFSCLVFAAPKAKAGAAEGQYLVRILVVATNDFDMANGTLTINYTKNNGTYGTGTYSVSIGNSVNGQSSIFNGGGANFGYFPDNGGVWLDGFPTSVQVRMEKTSNGWFWNTDGSYDIYLQVYNGNGWSDYGGTATNNGSIDGGYKKGLQSWSDSISGKGYFGNSHSVSSSLYPEIKSGSISISGETSVCSSNTSQTYTASLSNCKDQYGTTWVGSPTSWSSSNTSIATITSAGVATFKTTGGAVTFTATYPGLSQTKTVTYYYRHNLSKFTNASSATCTASGTIDSWKCSVCNKIFSNSTGTTEVSTTTVAALGHNFSGAYHNVSAGTHNRKCLRCNTYGLNGTVNATENCSGGTANCVDKAVCSKCSTAYGSVNANNHKTTLTKTSAKAATCIAEGNNDYWYCSSCNKYFSNSLGTSVTTVSDQTLPINPTNHASTLVKHNAAAATCVQTGNNEYWSCASCNKYFSDAAGSNVTTVEAQTLPTNNSHAWNSTPTWNWTDKSGGGYDATATYTCTRSSDHTSQQTATVTSSTTPATCEDAGSTVYTATVDFNGTTKTATKTDTLPALGHTYDYEHAVFNWSGYDCETVTATCGHNSAHKDTVTTDFNTVTKKPARNTSDNVGENEGKITYTASFTKGGVTKSDSKTKTLPALDTYADLTSKTTVVDFSKGSTIDITDTKAAATASISYTYEGVSTSGNEVSVYPAKSDMPAQPVSNISGSYGTLSVSGNTLTYTPTKINADKYDAQLNTNAGIDTFYVTEKVTGADGFAQNGVYTYKKIQIIPANSVYYDDSFVNGDDENETDGLNYINAGNADSTYGKWNKETNNKKADDLVDTTGASTYGFVKSNDNFVTYSGGSAHFVRVNESNKNPYATVTFTFAGTGFDLISATKGDSGVFVVKYKKSGTNTWKQKMVDTYYGYNYGLLWYSDYTPRFKVSETQPKGYVPVYPTTGVTKATAEDNPAIYVVSTFGTVYSKDTAHASSTDQAKGWVKAESSTTSMYQVPVIKLVMPSYDVYDVEIQARFTAAYGHYLTDGDTKYFNLYVDGIRIYDPLGPDVNVANNIYASDLELYPKYSKIKDAVLAETGSAADTALMLDGIEQIGKTDLENIKNSSPTNEIYVKPGQSVAFKVESGNYLDVQIGMRAPKDGATKAVLMSEKNGSDVNSIVNINTASEVYYSINKKLDTDVAGKVVTVTNDGNNILALTFIKTTSSTRQDEGTPTRVIYQDDETAPTAIRMLKAYRAAQTVTEPSIEVFDPTEPSSEVVDPTEPSSEVVDPTEPSSEVVDPTEPTSEVVEPTEPTTGETEITEPQGDNGSDGKRLNWLTKIIVRTIQFIRDLIAGLK